MSATFRLERRTRDYCIVHVQLEAGAPADKIRVHANELKRFCWSVLADLDPVEAEAAAAEGGQSLAQVLYGAFTPIGSRKPVLALPRVGTKKRRILEALCSGHFTTDALRDVVPDAERPDGLLFEMRQSGFVERKDRGAHGPVALWGLTEDGERKMAAEMANAGRRAA